MKVKKIVTKEILVDRIQDELKGELNKTHIRKVVEKMLLVFNKSLINGETVRMVGHFTLRTVITKPRMAMNLQTKEKMLVPAKRVPKIKFSDELKKLIAHFDNKIAKKK